MESMVAGAPPDHPRTIPVRVDRHSYRALKRATDLTVAFTLMLASTPLWLTAAVLVKLTSLGPILYAQTRCGRGGIEFRCYKFRTMVEGAHDRRADVLHLNMTGGPTFKSRTDPRITNAGRWLRKLSIDELPQLINVLRGEMSVVGPRPPLPVEVDHYTAEQLARLSVKPGLTCLWQVSGRSELSFERWVELDLEYIQRRSLTLDLMIMLRTVPAVLLARGAY